MLSDFIRQLNKMLKDEGDYECFWVDKNLKEHGLAFLIVESDKTSDKFYLMGPHGLRSHAGPIKRPIDEDTYPGFGAADPKPTKH